MLMVLRKSPQFGFDLLGGDFQSLLQRAALGQFAHRAGAGDGERAAAGEIPDVADALTLHSQRYFDGIPALADTHRPAGGGFDGPLVARHVHVPDKPVLEFLKINHASVARRPRRRCSLD